MGAGMAEFVCKDLGQGTVSVAEYNKYCHYVAGLVGEGLTRLFAATGVEGPGLLDASDLSNRWSELNGDTVTIIGTGRRSPTVRSVPNDSAQRLNVGLRDLEKLRWQLRIRLFSPTPPALRAQW